MGQLRGSSAAAPAPAPPTTLSQLQRTDCGCNEGVCTCLRSNSSLAEAEGQQQLEQSLLNHTPILSPILIVAMPAPLAAAAGTMAADRCVEHWKGLFGRHASQIAHAGACNCT